MFGHLTHSRLCIHSLFVCLVIATAALSGERAFYHFFGLNVEYARAPLFMPTLPNSTVDAHNSSRDNYSDIVSRSESQQATPIHTVDDNTRKNARVGCVNSTNGCDFYVGKWVKDDHYPLYQSSSCPYIDSAFRCQSNGRPDSEYQKWRWQPDGCDLPRFDGLDFLERLRGKRLMFVGDSMNRNQFESILCLLHASLSDKSTMHEKYGHPLSKGRGYFVFKFKDFNCTVEFVRSHFLVREAAQPKSVLLIDRIDKSSGKWRKADILVFNTGHWWAHSKTSKGKNYYKEGNNVYSHLDVLEAYGRALRTWGRWVDNNIDPTNQLVVFRGYSSAHFRGREWGSGGTCRGEMNPISESISFPGYPPKMSVMEEVIRDMRNPVAVLNITRLTRSRKDGHPSIYGAAFSPGSKLDCSHWCLPGVPDTWNQLLYATLLHSWGSQCV